ncbi:hypothetical protein EC973_005149 [Apophysomyces ossiformis]|uniref:Uncharacterized protein n=1 Tax=Apophysomyces ossiformis TaxID=679940 RepID=A0A8H7EK73_9FUNG|nr:hypothetical protein EC973_005149 [Apophysomyces ossiformis]
MSHGTPTTTTMDVSSLASHTILAQKQVPVGNSSLYHTCRSVLDKLACVDGMLEYLETPLASPTESPTSSTSSTITSTTTVVTSSDPLSKLWTLCRRGSPLCTLFNALDPETPLKVDGDPNLNQINTCKASVYHFIVACRKELAFPEGDMFTISDLYQDDTNGFVKVVNTIDKILQLLEKRGVITVRSSSRDSDPDAPKDTRDKVVCELLDTERKFVQDMEYLQNYMRKLQQQHIVSPDTVHYLFGNLNALVDFQRRFLIQLEEMAEKAPEDQRWGHLFVQMEEPFAVYEPYCANYYSAQDLVVQETSKLQKVADILDPNYELPSMLIKPVQRICKYPLLINQLIKSTNKDWPYYAEMEEGLEAIKRVTEKVNETQRQHENMQMVEELKKRVINWDGRSIEEFGKLLLKDRMVMTVNENDRELHMFLFQKALLMCKDKDAKNNLLTKTNTMNQKKKRPGLLQLKGFVDTRRIVNIVNKAQNGTWALMVEYRNFDVERFVLRLRNEEQHKLWENALNKIKLKNRNIVPNTHLFSMPAMNSHFHHDSGFHDDDDDEAEEGEYEVEEQEEEFRKARSRSNSISAHIKAQLEWKSIPVANSRSHYPLTSANAPPLPRIPATGTTHHFSIDPHLYPDSPPPSNPLSPVDPSRPFTEASSPRRRQQQQQQQQQQPAAAAAAPSEHTVLSGMATSFLGGMESTDKTSSSQPLSHAAPIGRSQSHSLGASMSNHLSPNSYHHPHHQPHPHPYPNQHPQHQQQARLRSQSSPNIRKRNGSHGEEEEERIPQVPPIHIRTIPPPSQQQQQQQQQQQHYPHPHPHPHPSHHHPSNKLPSPLEPHPEHLPPFPTASSSYTLAVPSSSPNSIKIKLNFDDGIYVIVSPQDILFSELMEKVLKKIRPMAHLNSHDSLRLKYQDEDGDLITINSDDDVQMAFESRASCNTVSLFVSR